MNAQLTEYQLSKKIEFEDLILNRRMFESLIYLSEIKGGFLTTDYLKFLRKCYNIRMKPIEDVLNKLEDENNG